MYCYIHTQIHVGGPSLFKGLFSSKKSLANKLCHGKKNIHIKDNSVVHFVSLFKIQTVGYCKLRKVE